MDLLESDYLVKIRSFPSFLLAKNLMEKWIWPRTAVILAFVSVVTTSSTQLSEFQAVPGVVHRMECTITTL